MNDDFNFENILFGGDIDLNDNNNEIFDKEKWLEEKIKQKERAFDMIDLTTQSVTTDKNALKEYFEVSARFPTFGAANTLLVLAQNPQAEDVRSFDEWKAAGTVIKKGEKGIMLLQRTSEYVKVDGDSVGHNYTTKIVFDIKQTNAEIPDKEQSSKSSVMKALVKSSPVPIIMADHLEGNRKCFFDPNENCIFIVRTENGSEIFYTLTTEIAHARMQYKNDGYERGFYDDKARCVSCILAKRCGFAAPELPAHSLDIFSDYDTVTERREILNEITRTANSITHAIERVKERGKNEKNER